MRNVLWWLVLAVSCLDVRGVSATEDVPPLVALADLAANASAFDGRTIRVAGTVARIAFTPDIRGNQTVYHLELKDESGKRVSIVCTQVGFFEETDELEILGTFRLQGVRSRGLEVPGEIDSREGEVRVLRSVREEVMRRQREQMTESEMTSISVSPVKTGWDTLLEWSGMIATAFAIIACIPLFLRGRRFQIGLKAIQEGEATVLSEVDGRFLVLPLRLISAGAQDPVIRKQVELRANGFSSQSDDWRAADEELRFPISITEPLKASLRFRLPSGAEHIGASRADCIFVDHFSKRRLRTSFVLHWPAQDSKKNPPAPETSRLPKSEGTEGPASPPAPLRSASGKIQKARKHRKRPEEG